MWLSRRDCLGQFPIRAVIPEKNAYRSGTPGASALPRRRNGNRASVLEVYVKVFSVP
jgi:hypothetical protein